MKIHSHDIGDLISTEPNDSAYLYLGRPEWAAAWIDGGTVPIAAASTYRSAERNGVMTPDELVQSYGYGRSSIPDSLAKEIAQDFAFGAHVQFEDCSFIVDGEEFDVSGYETGTYLEDAFILCFSSVLDATIMQGLEKQCVVKIQSLRRLAAELEEQLARESILGRVLYTRNWRRNHWLKGIEDQWQHEVRLAWPSDGPVQRDVVIPPGTATSIAHVPTLDIPAMQRCNQRSDYDHLRKLRDAELKHLMSGYPTTYNTMGISNHNLTFQMLGPHSYNSSASAVVNRHQKRKAAAMSKRKV